MNLLSIINIRSIAIILVLVLGACDSSILDKNPQDSYSDPVVFSDPSLVEYYLNAIYNDVEYGWRQRGHGYQTGVYVAETVTTKGAEHTPYDISSIGPGNLGPDRGNLSWHHYSNIYKLNYLLANIDQVVENASENERESILDQVNVLKGEAYCLRAIFYHDICRAYGGVPLISEPSNLGDDFSNVTRNTFAETIEFIVNDCDEAAKLLKPKSESVMGRANKEMAMGVKSRMLLFAASDLTADGSAPNELLGYTNPDRDMLWKAARDAAKDLIDLGTLELEDFGAPDQELAARGYYDLFRSYDLSSDEIIWGRMHLKETGTRIFTNRRLGPNGNGCHGNNSPYGNSVDQYQMDDGSDFFEHFEVNSNREYINKSDKFTNPNIYKNREPRFYATVLFDSAIWQPRFPGLAELDPLGIYDRRTRVTIENGEVVNERFGIDSRQGPFTPWNGTYTGYLLKKFTDDAVIGRDEANENVIIRMRYPEILLNYAEALIHLGDIETASQYINKVRTRVGLPEFVGDPMEALKYERKIELFAENVAWYDIRRWKELEENFDQDLYGIDIREVTEDGVKSTTWRQVEAAPRKTFSQKLYWMPIEDDEMNKAPQLVQNPGY